jgi:hypothetical protein
MICSLFFDIQHGYVFVILPPDKMLNFGSLGFAVKVSPAVVLLGGGSATAARTSGASRQFPENLNFLLWQS